MKEIAIQCFNDYREIISDHQYREWVYRGQNNYSYQLQSSLYRAFEINEEIRSASKQKHVHIRREKYEKEMINSFKKGCKIYLDKTPPLQNSDLDWLALMQHYGAPTRLLDFSYSPYIALYFAISGATTDASVYCIEKSKLNDISNMCNQGSVSEIMTENKEESNCYIIPYEPKNLNERLFVQQGLFLIPNTLNFTHQDILNRFLDKSFIKIRIRKESFVEIIEELRRVNISASSIYPGFEGFCKSFENIGVLPLTMIRSLPDYFIDD